MRNPEKTDFNLEYFKGMSFDDFVAYWKQYNFIGDPKKYYTKLTGEKVPVQKKKKDDETIND